MKKAARNDPSSPKMKSAGPAIASPAPLVRVTPMTILNAWPLQERGSRQFPSDLRQP
jgi:hypothetical protein